MDTSLYYFQIIVELRISLKHAEITGTGNNIENVATDIQRYSKLLEEQTGIEQSIIDKYTYNAAHIIFNETYTPGRGCGQGRFKQLIGDYYNGLLENKPTKQKQGDKND